MTEDYRRCELCREHSGLQEKCRTLTNRCDHFEHALKPDGIVFTEIGKMRKWLFWFMGSLVIAWIVNTGLTYKAANNTEKTALEAAKKAIKLFQASQP
jgi:hypothetical protein